MSKLHIAYDDVYLDWKLGAGDGSHPTNPVRAKLAVELLESLDPVMVKPSASESDRDLLSHVHSDEYISKVLDRGHCGEWYPDQTHLGEVALEMAAGTIRMYEKILSGEAQVAFNPQGAKHHAQYDHSSGFCVFNDFALAADIATQDHGLKVAIIDIDAHHGDGVENLTRENPNVLTFSIHEQGIFPGTGNADEAENNVFNFPLNATTGIGDGGLLAGINRFIPIARAFAPDLLFITSGADGLAEDPLTNLQYSLEGYAAAARLITKAFPDTPKLMGGAGGYLPDTGTPEVWAAVAGELSRSIR